MERCQILFHENKTSKFNSMKTWSRGSAQELLESNNKLSQNPFYEPLSNQDESFYNSYLAPIPMPRKEKIEKSSLIRRITPFLILEVFLIGFFPYMFLTGKVVMQNFLTTGLLFPFIIVNLLFFDFALCNYYGGKKIFKTWCIESILSFVLLYLLI